AGAKETHDDHEHARAAPRAAGHPERDHIRGPVTAPITLLEYGDYECPYCGAAHPIVHEVRRRMGKRLCFVYRHFPLTNVHPHAEPAAEAAEAAGAQGRFWRCTTGSSSTRT